MFIIKDSFNVEIARLTEEEYDYYMKHGLIKPTDKVIEV